mmetsp:Transcript_16097/g.25047  ORF Transcript_16097/g.25047 Transcript_16097/m.25047 type:complete len:106 (+) Transcript_16097:434-751(+)
MKTAVHYHHRQQQQQVQVQVDLPAKSLGVQPWHSKKQAFSKMNMCKRHTTQIHLETRRRITFTVNSSEITSRWRRYNILKALKKQKRYERVTTKDNAIEAESTRE